MRFKDFIKKYFIHKREPVDIFEPLRPTEIRRFVIPVGGLSRERAEQQIRELMKDYKEKIDWDEKIDLKYDQKKYDFHRTPYIPDPDLWFPTKKQKKMMDDARLLIWNISQ